MKKIVSKTLMACAVTAALGMASSSVLAQSTYPTFTINEGAVSGAIARELTAGKIIGGYTEVGSFTPTSEAGGTFTASLKWEADGFYASNGTTSVPSQLGATTDNQYRLYALYTAQGTYSTSSSGNTFSYTPGGSFQFFLDPNSNTSFVEAATGADQWGTLGSGDDVLLATGVPTAGEGNVTVNATTCPAGGGQGINCGSFGTTSSFVLEEAGLDYFIAPSPFYQLSFQSGQLNNFPPSGRQVINGSLDVVFGASNEVPEPATIAMVGLGLLGLGLARRRKQA